MFRAIGGYFRAAATWTAATVLGSIGAYQVLDPSRKILSAGQRRAASMTANQLSATSLPQLRAICRRLERDNPTARAAVEGLVAQVVGTGIALEPDHGDDLINERLRTAWVDYIAGCDISGKRSIYALEEQAMRDIATAGEFLWRLAVLPERAEVGQVPLCVLPLECEWITTESPAAPSMGVTTAQGIEVDRWGRPIAYWLKNPDTLVAGESQRVVASEIVHGFERRRALQNRGEPLLCPVIERIAQEGDLVDAELRSAITCAGIGIVIKSTGHGALDTTTNGTTDDPAMGIGVGAVARLFPNEDITAFSHNRPGQQIQAFRGTLRGDISASMRISQRWLDRDYSRANYSSMRADNLDSERLLAPLREWLGHATIGELYRRALPYLCILAGVPMPKRIAYKLLPDGTPYVDPVKDVRGAVDGIAAGLTTHQEQIAMRGGDYRKVWEQLARERAEAQALGLSLDMSSSNAPAPASQIGEVVPPANDQPKANA